MLAKRLRGLAAVEMIKTIRALLPGVQEKDSEAGELP